MLISKITLIKMVMHLRRKMNMPNDECWCEFLHRAENREISEIWEGLDELWNISQGIERIRFAYCLV